MTARAKIRRPTMPSSTNQSMDRRLCAQQSDRVLAKDEDAIKCSADALGPASSEAVSAAAEAGVGSSHCPLPRRASFASESPIANA
ncbi:uncharacterized protein PAN0_004d2336 [Moesziomyces antarcticus]|uniref:Uncharacterized protein n=1 Tax=Pseudozyma antarctica TaxID=84753 RepID=A0A081CBT1_PSEA2|nr:uncharacterized protein PAN0_004d2336 [Moesziomyces antarcticus]GAK64127.1 hypothetical protein PAN0_004d2336 [Moesziomyces antarcticus]